MLQVPKAGHHRAPELPASWFPAPGSTAAVVGGIFICLTPQLQSSATGLRIVGSVPPHFSLLCKVCTPQQLLLISVSHWCRSFLYCKETYLRLLIAVWFGALLQTPFCSGARSLGGCGCHCHQSSGQRRMSWPTRHTVALACLLNTL